MLDAAAVEGLLVLQASPDVVRFAPSLVVKDADIDEGLARFERAVSKLGASSKCCKALQSAAALGCSG